MSVGGETHKVSIEKKSLKRNKKKCQVFSKTKEIIKFTQVSISNNVNN